MRQVGNEVVAGSPQSLFNFEDDKGACGQKDAQGFIKLDALRLRTLGLHEKEGP